MGAFLVNFHVRSDSSDKVRESLESLGNSGWIAGPHQGWVSFWDEQASRQDTDRIKHLAEKVSSSTKRPLIAFMVHDSDIFCYWLYGNGRQLDEFNSYPRYWGDEQIDEAELAADSDTLVKFCRPGTTTAQLRELLKQRTTAELEAGIEPAYVFAEECLMKLTNLLGLREDAVLTDFEQMDSEGSAEELGAEWFGSAEPPDHDVDAAGQLAGQPPLSLPKAPLLEAAQRNDLATIKTLVAEGLDVNEIPSGYQVTALAMAAAYGTPPTIRGLVDLGADIHRKGREGPSPIRFATQTAKIENLRVLAELGADVNEYSAEIGSLLHLAVMMQSPPDVVRTLLELGVDANRKNEAGVTAVDIARGNIASSEQMRVVLQQTGSKSGAEHQQRLDDHRRRLEEVEQLLNSWQA